MKKSLLAMLLAVAMVAPVLAEKGDMSINGKVGFGLNNYGSIFLEEEAKDTAYSLKVNVPVSLTAEFFYEFIDNLSAGVGVNYSFNSNIKDEVFADKIEVGTTNIYLAVKPEAKIDSKIFTSIYAIGQIGISMIRLDISELSVDNPDTGLYLGFGAGTTIANQVLLELLCSASNGKISESGQSVDVQYTAVTVNVGYKFSL